MSDAMDAVREMLRADEMAFADHGDRVAVPFADDGGRWSAAVDEVNGCLVCTADYPVNVPDEHRPAVAELLARLNWPLVLGNWEMDFADGQVRFRAAVPVRSVPVTVDLARDVCHTAWATFARGWRPLSAVAAGAATPADAIADAKARRDRDRQAFATIWAKLGFAPDEDPWDPPAAG